MKKLIKSATRGITNLDGTVNRKQYYKRTGEILPMPDADTLAMAPRYPTTPVKITTRNNRKG
jgi:hypothetical protein